MNKAEMIARQLADGLNIAKIWGDVLVNVKTYGVVGDGIVDDTAAIQTCIDSNYGKTIFFPPGTYKVSGLTLNSLQNVMIIGSGRKNTILTPTGNNKSIFTWDQQYAYVIREFRDFGISGNGFTGCYGFNVLRGRQLYFERLYFKDLLYGIAIDRGYKISISDILQDGTVAYSFQSTVVPEYIFDLTVNNVQAEAAVINLSVPWFTINRCVNSYFGKITTQSLTGSNVGFSISDGCEGVFLTDVVIPWPTTGIVLTPISGRLPYDVQLENVAIDQFTVSGMIINGGRTMISNSLFVNGHDRSNIGPGMVIKSGSNITLISNTHVGGNDYDGLVIESGTSNTSIVNSTIITNGLISGNDLVAVGARVDEPKISNSRITTSNVVGQIVANGETSKFIYYDTVDTQTAANTTETTLKTYTLPALSFKPFQRIRIKASGLFAANGNTKTVRLYLGATLIGTSTGTFNGLFWDFECEVLYVTNILQNASTIATVGATSAASVFVPAMDTTINNIIKITGQNGVASAGDIISYSATIEIC